MGRYTFRPFGGGALAVASDDVRHDRSCFADEIGIDFPSVAHAVDRIRSAFLADERTAALSAAIRLSPREAREGATVPLVVPLHVRPVWRSWRNLDRAVRSMRRQRHRAASASASGVGTGRCPRRCAFPLHRHSPLQPAHARRGERSRHLVECASGCCASWPACRAGWQCSPRRRVHHSHSRRSASSRHSGTLRTSWRCRLLGRRRPIGRVLPLSPLIVNLLVLPFGTALGAYAFWIRLTKESRVYI